MLGRYMTNIILIVVTAVWVVNFAARFFVADYEPSPTIDGIFGAIVGGAFAIGRFAKKEDNEENEDDEDETPRLRDPEPKREDDGNSAGTWY